MVAHTVGNIGFGFEGKAREMADKFSVDPDALRTSATGVRSTGDDLTTSHTAAHGRLLLAEAGWTGKSSQALVAFTAQLKANAVAASTCIEDHSQHMHGAATRYVAGEQDRADAFAALRCDGETTAYDPKSL